MSLLGDALEVLKKGADAVGDVAGKLGDAFKDLVEKLRGIANDLGCIAGILGYGYASAWVHTFGGGNKRRLSSREKQVMSQVFNPNASSWSSLDLDEVWLITDANLSGIPVDVGGICLGNSVYLESRSFDTCDVDDEDIDDYRAFMLSLLHEFTHVAQYQEYGRLSFACHYGRAILSNFSTNNHFEQQAYYMQDEFEDELLEAIANVCAGDTAQGELIPSITADWFWVVWS